jgi:malonate transporter and related proteins
MILNSIFPVFALVILGSVLKRCKMTNETFLKTSDKLIYYIFFPALLFWKIGGSSMATTASWDLCKAALCAIVALYVLSGIGIKAFGVSDYQAGTFSQSCYRFNTYVGMAIVLNAVGEEGVRHFGILIGIVIPIINVFAVSALIWFSEMRFSPTDKYRFTAKAVISNPLIIACIAGILYSKCIGGFPTFIENTLQLAAFITLPLALLSIGASLTLKNIRHYLKPSLIASVYKLLLLPAAGYFFLKIFGVTGIPFKTGMIFFALPTSTAIYVLSSQLGSDTDLASATIVLSTMLSFVSLSVVLLFF